MILQRLGVVQIRHLVNAASVPKKLPPGMPLSKTGERHVILMGDLTEVAIRRFLKEFYHEKYGSVDFHGILSIIDKNT